MEQLNLELQNTIRKHFPVITEKALQEEIASVGQLLHFNAGKRIMDFGAYVKMVPLVVKGSIKVVREDDEQDQELFLYFLRAGETCTMSFSCCLMNKQSDIRTTAEDDTTLIGIPIKYIDEWMMKYPSWKNFVMRSYDERMQELVKTIDNIAFYKLDDRLLHYLQEKAKASSTSIIHATHQEIAQDMNASREAISRLLKKLEKTNQIKLGRNKIELVMNGK